MHGFLRAALILGLLQAVGPFAIDMYLPALPSIGASLGADIHEVQASLMAFFIALAIGQLFYGPVSDMFGRKLPLYVGLAVFGLASIGCMLARDASMLIGMRFVQGLGACACFAIPRAIVRDLHTGADAARLMAMLMLVFSVSPMLAPIAGSLVAEWAGWRAIFGAIAGLAVVAILMVAFALPETRPPALRVSSGLGSALAAYRLLLRDRHFVGVMAIGVFGVASFHTYLAGSSFVLIDHFGLSPRQYSVAFAANAMSFILAAQWVGRLGRRYGLPRVVRLSATAYGLTMTLLFLLQLAGIEHWLLLIGLLMVGYAFLGLVTPATTVLALDGHGTLAGTASALIGTGQFVMGALAIGALGVFADGTPRPMAGVIAACAIACAGLAWRLKDGPRGPAAGTAQRPSSTR